MKPKIIKIVPITVLPMGNFRSFPTEIGTACPLDPAKNPNPKEHPQQMSQAIDLRLYPMEPGNDSTLAISCLPEAPPDQLELLG